MMMMLLLMIASRHEGFPQTGIVLFCTPPKLIKFRERFRNVTMNFWHPRTLTHTRTSSGSWLFWANGTVRECTAQRALRFVVSTCCYYHLPNRQASVGEVVRKYTGGKANITSRYIRVHCLVGWFLLIIKKFDLCEQQLPVAAQIVHTEIYPALTCMSYWARLFRFFFFVFVFL